MNKLAIVRGMLIGVIVLLCVVGTIACLYVVGFCPTVTGKEQFLLAVLLTMLSTLASWLCSKYYAVIGAQQNATQMIDTVAQQSTEKLMNLSRQLYEVCGFLDECLEVATAEYNVYAANNAFRHRVTSAKKMLELLRSSNDTFASDWTGVVSESVRRKIEGSNKAQRELFKDLITYRQLSTPDDDSESVQTARSDIMKRIEDRERHLPSAALPTVPKSPAIEMVDQTWSCADVNKQEGKIVFRVLRPVYSVTGSGKLFPQMRSAPDLVVSFIDGPAGVDRESIAVHVGTGTTYDFNVHMKSREYGTFLQQGTYSFIFSAIANKNFSPGDEQMSPAGSQQTLG